MTLERIGELEELPVDLNDTEFDNAIQKAHNLKKQVFLTQTEYDALTPNAETVYFIIEG